MPSPALRQLALQAGAAILVLSLLWPHHGVTGAPINWGTTAAAIGLVAGLAATLARQPWWWRLIHFLFVPAAWALSTLPIEPGWYLLTFIGLLLIYRGALTTRVPLYLSTAAAATVLAERLPPHPATLIDLGAGIGSAVLGVARARPDCTVIGIENSPLPWLLGWLRTRGLPNCQWQWGNLWNTDVSRADLVYAFLSPAPMAPLWEKLRAEMPRGSLFVSNSFPVPDLPATEAVAAASRVLHLYRIDAPPTVAI